MNILISSGIFPPDIGGPANFVPRIARWLVQRGHTVQVVCWSNNIDHDDTSYPFKIHRIPRRGSRLKRLIQTISALYTLGKSADAVFVNGLDLEARIAATLLRKPELHKVVGDRAWEIARVRNWYDGTIDEYQSAQKSLRLRLFDKIRDASLARARMIITPSHYLAKIASGWNINKKILQVIYNATRLDQSVGEFALPSYPGKTIVTVCRLVPWKGVDRLIANMRDFPNVRFVVAGDGPDRVKLQEHAQAQNVAERVIFLGQISKPQVRALLNSSDIFILNSGYEGLPHVVLEAMAARVPVITTDVGGTGEVVKHGQTGLLIPYGDDKALTAAMRYLLDADDDVRQRLVTNAYQMVEQHFNEEKCFLAYETALASLLLPGVPLMSTSIKNQHHIGAPWTSERVLILSKDPTLLANQSGFGDTLQRHIYYAERLNHHAPGSEIRILTYTNKQASHHFLSPSPNLKIFGTASAHRALFMVDAIRALRRLCADGWTPTVITTQGPYEDGQLGLWLARRFRARFIPQLHFDLFSAEWLKESYLNPLRRVIATRVLKSADTVRVVSQMQKRKFIDRLKLSPESIHVIPVSVSVKLATQTKEACKAAIHPELSGHKVVLFVGRLCTQKNMRLWVDVAQQVLAQAPDTRFLLAGNGPVMKEIQNSVRKKGLEAAFIFLGNVPHHKLSDVYGAADLFLLTSHYEGFGRVIVEANLAGVPVVATICTGPEDIVVDGKTGYLCRPGDQESLSARVLALLHDDSKRQRFGEAARQHVERLFGREHLADLLVRMWTA